MDFFDELSHGKDLWDTLKESKRPIIIYGMGNGGDKLISYLQKKEIPYDAVMASDAFCRGQSFHGHRVFKYSEIKEQYQNPIILIAFASRFEEVISDIEKLDEKEEVYIPDLPVAGETLFDQSFYFANLDAIKEAYNLFEDEHSKGLYQSIIEAKYTGKLKPLLSFTTPKEEEYKILQIQDIRTFADLGAYTGDTLDELLMENANLESGILFEPDEKSMKKLNEKIQNLGYEEKFKTYLACAWNENTEGIFASSSNRNSTLLGYASHEAKEKIVKCQTLDSTRNIQLDYIKYDVEGAEYEALLGSSETILRDKPKLLVSLYHRPEDLFKLPRYIKEQYPFYHLYLRRKRVMPAWEIDLLCIPEEREGTQL